MTRKKHPPRGQSPAPGTDRREPDLGPHHRQALADAGIDPDALGHLTPAQIAAAVEALQALAAAHPGQGGAGASPGPGP